MSTEKKEDELEYKPYFIQIGVAIIGLLIAMGLTMITEIAMFGAWAIIISFVWVVGALYNICKIFYLKNK